MKLRVYLDTSILSVYLDNRTPERMSQTRKFWNTLDSYEVSTSALTKIELERTPDPARRAQLLDLLRQVTVHAVTAEMLKLSDEYMHAGIFGTGYESDAIHVAAAVILRQDILLSWNFKHLVNRRRRAMINDVNVMRGVPAIEIVSPLEL